MKYLFLFVLAALLSACGTNLPTPQIVERAVHIPIPDDFLKACEITAPMSKAEYLNAMPSMREEIMYSYSKALLTDLGNCNLQIKSTKEWDAKQRQLFKPK